MKLYNTRTRKKEEIRGQKIGLYACGPTVYDRTHIGNFRAYVNVDILKRTLRYFGHEVKHVMNITDIEDKIIKKAEKTNTNYKTITEKYEKLFWEDFEKLNLLHPEIVPHATDDEVIAKMIKIIEKLITDGFAYKSPDGSVYFSIDKFDRYGSLSRLDKSSIKTGARVSQDEYEKDNARDFVLWKAAKKGEPQWEASFGRGRPGWHIECSAMSLLYLGETVDIHAGGVDLVFPHHENEAAQSEAYTGKQFVKHWFHGEHLLVEGKKMSKSLGNLFNLDDLAEKFQAEPLSLRLLFLQSHYRDRLNFTARSIEGAQNALSGLRGFVDRASQAGNGRDISDLTKKALFDFDRALKNDLGTSGALSVVFEFLTEVNKLKDFNSEQALSFMERIDSVFGLNLEPKEIDSKIKSLFDEYLKARELKDWKRSDEIRKEIFNQGWIAEDSGEKSKLRRK